MKKTPAASLYIALEAEISSCGEYRYDLWRCWDARQPTMVFVMQNPSVANAELDDATIRRCVGFARRDGFGSIRVRNIFALRATDEKKLLTHADPFGPLNYKRLLRCFDGLVHPNNQLVVAWGVRLGRQKLAAHYDNAEQLLSTHMPLCFGLTKSGDPRHPLMLPNTAKLVPWEPKETKIT